MGCQGLLAVNGVIGGGRTGGCHVVCVGGRTDVWMRKGVSESWQRLKDASLSTHMALSLTAPPPGRRPPPLPPDRPTDRSGKAPKVEEEAPKFVAFTGGGARLDGKKARPAAGEEGKGNDKDTDRRQGRGGREGTWGSSCGFGRLGGGGGGKGRKWKGFLSCFVFVLFGGGEG